MNREQAKAVLEIFNKFPNVSEVCGAHRKHLEAIEAFAEGGEIRDTINGWTLVSPCFTKEFTCYIKPKTIKERLFLQRDSSGMVHCTPYPEETNSISHNYFNNRTADIGLLYNIVATETIVVEFKAVNK